ncbi:MAG: hypothetical protein EPO24_00075 [Bacteroidetes bacterium]|nr:MAG: hypothetical protein EPO24_00075 [Bacteroidota bacterium]
MYHKNTTAIKTLQAALFFVLLTVFPVYHATSQNAWIQKVSGGGLGNPFCVNPWNDNIIYSATGSNVLRISRNRGYSWQTLSTITQGTAIKSVQVSARDTNVILVAMEASSTDKIFKSTDNGTSWTITLTKEFYYWGIPLAYLPERDDDTVYTMGGRTIYRSTNFGSTWDSVRANPFGTSNQGWEYCIIRSDSPSVLLVADNASGIWKSYDYGVNWRQVYVASGEVPALACSKDDPKTIYGTKWGGGGGFVKSTNGGETWNTSSQFNGINMWGVAVSTKNPNFVITGTYGPSYSTTGGIYISRDAGTTWQRTYSGLVATTNYGCLVLDTLNLYVLQGDGIWRYNTPSGTLALTAPNGGEIWHANSAHQITWSASGIVSVKLEYSLNNGSSWNVIAASVSATNGTYTWVVPDSVSDQYLVRISDASNGSVNDQSDAAFTVDRVFITLLAPAGGEEWMAGSTQTISWISTGILNVKVQFSTNSGSDWNDIVSSMHASVGSYSWIIPRSPSSSCKVKVIDIADAEVFDMNDVAFSIVDTAQLFAAIVLSDTMGNTDTLQFGEKTLATDGLDSFLGEVELSVKPPLGTFDVRWNVSGTNGTKLDFRDTLSDVRPAITYTLEVQPEAGGYPITLRWNPLVFPLEYFTLRDAQTQGAMVSIDMLEDSICVIDNPSITAVEIVHSKSLSLPLHLYNRWNLISLPVKVEDRSKSALFPTAISNAFEYTYKYHAVDSLSNGKGYWLKFSGEQMATLSGARLAYDSVSVSTGWNIIGSLSIPVSTAMIVSEPPGIVESSFYGYQNGYSTVDTLKPGGGYWVKATKKGKLILSGATTKNNGKKKE